MTFSTKTTDLIKKITAPHPNIQLTIGILHKGQMAFHLFNHTGEIPYVPHIYEMGSIGKTITASLFAKYVHSGKMALEDSMAKYFPALDEARYFPNLRRLATHTAGYPTRYPMDAWGDAFRYVWTVLRGLPSPNPSMDEKNILTLVNETKLQDKDYPWSYANFGIALLGQAVAQVAGKAFLPLVNEFISQELALSNTTVGALPAGLLQGYTRKNRLQPPWLVDEKELIIPAGAGFTTTAQDLLHFAKLNMENALPYLPLCHETYAKVTDKFHMGLAWWKIVNTSAFTFHHAGDTDGFSTALAFSKEKEMAIAILYNNESKDAQGRYHLTAGISEELANK
ncbi:MAG: beta-lactamase family protein [Defluviitaleaceae bacterium]|nr:beta-lactamase family protein [Defluviitaleaceae bacterium]MCL2276039.1 beta-lactamase family protein [Defluviitaleaceae bacterium]